jgi:hypothetical protein
MMRMELSWEVKGYLADLIARENLGKIQIMGMRVGIDPETVEVNAHPEVYHEGYDAYPGMNPNEKAALYLIEHTGNPNLLIETVLDIAKRDGIGGKWYTKIFTELNSLMERTMQCRIGAEWNIIPIFDENLQTSEKATYIERKLKELGFNKTLINYKDAINTYKTSYKGSISLLRSTFESLVDEIITSKGESLKSNQKDKIAQLEKLEIIKEIDNQECKKCHHKKKDSEFNYSYDIYSLLSHYGSHKELLTEELANFLFTSTLGFVWFLINRYENTGVK